ncbi:unnamed protein product [Ilex paraguariensis]|uniref:Uncharacterized protein n=1 Tax=Ilex paraguariensis TaxID=185542 RepID=A0ABC8RS60_9AQUA
MERMKNTTLSFYTCIIFYKCIREERESMAEADKLHVVLFPWLAFRHIIPFLELSKPIAGKGHKVSFISTPRNIDRLPKFPPNSAPLLSLVKLPLPRVDNLPEHAEATIDVPYDKVQYLKKAFDGLQTELTQFLKISNLDWIIYDFPPHWLPQIASQLGISLAFFSTVNAWSGAFFGSAITMANSADYRTKLEDFTVAPKWVPFPSCIAFWLHEIKRLYNSVDDNIFGISDALRFGKTVMGCDVFLIRSCTELEPNWLHLLQELQQKPVVAVGLLPPSFQGDKGGKDDTWHTINVWLDIQEKESVVYVALGSEVTPSQAELTELALVLELCGLPFFWALRKQHDSANSFELPDGFLERTEGRGVVWTSWVPQLRILAHDSVGGFVTRCDWSSVIEGLQFGRPLIMLPYLGDQGLIARVLEEKRVGIGIPSDGVNALLQKMSWDYVRLLR